MDVAGWLKGLGLERYEAVFRDNEIDWQVLPSLTAEDLKEIGITAVGHRRRLIEEIAALRIEAEPAPTLLRTEGAERRQLTVMFCDLVGSTALAARLDPEDLRDIIAAYHRAVAETVAGFDGFVAKYMGDGILVYFGYPQAHEDDAEHAVRAGLDCINAVGRLDVGSIELQARVGIASGLVVVGDLIGEGSAQEQSIVGETPNLAARLQAMAEPGAVLIAADTRRLVGNLFEYRDLGAVEVKGLAAPVPGWQVLRPSDVASRFEALRGSALTRLVGRDDEIDLLLRRWARAKAEEGQVVLVSGEPGFGKSRITAAFEERLRAERHLRLRYFCSPYRQDSALFPFIDQFGRALGSASNDPPASRLEKLEALLARVGTPEQDVALLADLMSLPGSERHNLPNFSPQEKKEKTLKALIRQLEGLARRRPVVMIFEDAHWIDPTSRELLDLTIARVRSLPVLLIVTFRPEFQPSWIGQPHVTLLALNRLDRRDRRALVAQIAGGKALPDEVVAQIVGRTDGVPLFVEELTKSVLESELLREEGDHYVLDGPLPPLAIPTSLHASLTARLDRLGPVRKVAQIGAAIGRWFRYGLLRAVSELPENELQASLARLVASELIFESGVAPDATYTFKHVLVQETAYGSLLRNRRQQLHGQIAEALEAHFPEMMESQPEVLARHYGAAGFAEKSVFYWSKAAQRSAARSAMAEAAAQFQKALDQLNLLPDDFARQRQELEFRSSMGVALRFVKGLAAPETGRALARARELWEQLGSPSDFVQVPYWQSLHHQNRGEFGLAQRLDGDLLRLSRKRNDSAGLILAHLSAGRTLWLMGRFAVSRSHLEQVLAPDDPISNRSIADQTGTHPHELAQAYLGNALFCLGLPDQALAQSNAVIARARRSANPMLLASSLSVSIRLLLLVGNNLGALDEWAGQLIAVATEQGFPHWRGEGTVYRGWAKVKNGEVAEGISLLRSGASVYRATGAQTFMPHYIALLAGAREIAGQIEEAMILLDEALQIVERTGERWFAAELNRHKGQLLLRQGSFDIAEKLYLKALRIGQEQQAKLWELRATVSLARLRRIQGRHAEARDLLAPVYRWFTEGFGTPDLKQAKALLEELNA
jgi:class 3 adenylate cyclase/tetratricopeptide (TPR) repeat protein